MNHEQLKLHLQTKGYKANTIKRQIATVSYFLNWLRENNFHQISGLTYKDLLHYVQHLQEKNKSASCINDYLDGVKKYFGFLKQQGLIQSNIAQTLKVRGVIKKIIRNPLDAQELTELYQAYQKCRPSRRWTKPMAMAHSRNLIILGLVIWQGLNTQDITLLETGHINTEEGTIYIPSTGLSNSRTLKLQPEQILPLHKYLSGIPKGKLIPGNAEGKINNLCKKIKTVYPTSQTLRHIRASVILNWLKQHNKRQVQYMIGHKWIVSTERYAQELMDDLTDAMTKYHPFGK